MSIVTQIYKTLLVKVGTISFLVSYIPPKEGQQLLVTNEVAVFNGITS